MNACWMGASAPGRPSPSTVVMRLPWAEIASTVQEYTGLPSISVVQEPQVARSQTFLAPVRSR